MTLKKYYHIGIAVDTQNGLMVPKVRNANNKNISLIADELKELSDEAQDNGLQDVQRTLQSLDPEQAKEQLLIMYDDKRIDDVVTILQAMSTDARKDILAEFTTPAEVEILADILHRISEGMPVSSLIKETDEKL